MGFLKDKKAQGALEYILIIAGVIVIATIVGYFVKTKIIESQDTGISDLNKVVEKAKGN